MKVFKYTLNCMLTNYIGKFRPRISTNKFDLNMYLLNFKTNKTAKFRKSLKFINKYNNCFIKTT